MKKEKTNRSAEAASELPQNIMPVGESVYENKRIYIDQDVYAQIHKFAAGKTENEHGGILVGSVVNDLGKENTIIEGFIEAKYNTATPTTLTFTHETWDHFYSVIDKKYKEKKIVGWIHTHPNFGIFLSENDKFIQQNFFTDVNQVAYVVDPIRQDEGFFYWLDGKLERCPGFYLFAKNGARLKKNVQYKAEEEAPAPQPKTAGKFIFPVIISLVAAGLLIATISLASKVNSMSMEMKQIGAELYRVENALHQQQMAVKALQQPSEKTEQDKSGKDAAPKEAAENEAAERQPDNGAANAEAGKNSEGGAQ